MAHAKENKSLFQRIYEAVQPALSQFAHNHIQPIFILKDDPQVIKEKKKQHTRLSLFTTRTSKKSDLQYKNAEDNDTMAYVPGKEENQSRLISQDDSVALYLAIRRCGFLHFDHEQVDVSFDSHGSASYQLTAHGNTYFFNDSTEAPIAPRWQQNCEGLDIAVNDLEAKVTMAASAKTQN